MMTRDRRAWIARLAVSSLAPMLGAAGLARGDTLFSYPLAASPTVIQSSWLNPEGSDADMYAYDQFTLAAAANITEVRWTGGYVYNAAYGHANNFTVAIYASVAGGFQPLVGNPQLQDTYLVRYSTAGNAHETALGNGLYSYWFTLPTAFPAQAGVKYWIRIEGEQVGYPDWGIAKGTGGDGAYFRFSTGAAMFQNVGGGDLCFTLIGTPLGGCTAPAVGTQPADQTVCDGFTGQAQFRVVASPAGPYTYRWQRETAPGSGAFTDLPNGTASAWDGGPSTGHGAEISGALTATLKIGPDADFGFPIGPAHARAYRCVITGACGGVTSAAARLTLSTGPVFAADPGDVRMTRRGAAVFVAYATGASSYRRTVEDPANPGVWTPMVDGPLRIGGAAVGSVSGAGTGTLTFMRSGPGLPASGVLASFACTATDGCGTTAGWPAVLTLCRGDYDGVNGVDLLDIFAFLHDWFGGSAGADFNGVNGVDLMDVFGFLGAWFGGAC